MYYNNTENEISTINCRPWSPWRKRSFIYACVCGGPTLRGPSPLRVLKHRWVRHALARWARKYQLPSGRLSKQLH